MWRSLESGDLGPNVMQVIFDYFYMDVDTTKYWLLILFLNVWYACRSLCGGHEAEDYEVVLLLSM